MKYAIVLAAVLGLAVAAPSGDYDKPEKPEEKPDKPEKPEPKPEEKPDWKPAPPPKPTDKPDWKPAPKPEECSKVVTYTEKAWEGKDEWKVEKTYTKTKTVYGEECKTWAPAPLPTEKPDWKPAPKPEECSKVVTYTEKTYEGKDEWKTEKVVTKTKTVYGEECKTWAPVPAPKPEEKTTWAPAPAPASTWAPAVVKSSTVAAPVAKWTGAADKQSVGMGALAIAAVAALL